MVSHLHEPNKTLIKKPKAPRHHAFNKILCFKKACRRMIGWKKTQQRNKFKGYKKPGIPRLQYLKYDSLNKQESVPSPVVKDSVAAIATEPQLQQPKDTTIAFVFEDVLFDTNKSDLRNEFTGRLDSLSAVIRNYQDYRILIVGHTDNSGGEKSNATLSKDRAEAVAAYLATTGIDRRVITAEGRGSREPIADNRRAEGRQKNRRVEIFLSFQ
ncbi:MAG TPA: OmpA family protein [Cyclobacteriaceae bacterium]|nr:OmpA family protein [Cyclobacteriaceae bacterium]